MRGIASLRSNIATFIFTLTTLTPPPPSIHICLKIPRTIKDRGQHSNNNYCSIYLLKLPIWVNSFCFAVEGCRVPSAVGKTLRVAPVPRRHRVRSGGLGWDDGAALFSQTHHSSDGAESTAGETRHRRIRCNLPGWSAGASSSKQNCKT